MFSKLFVVDYDKKAPFLGVIKFNKIDCASKETLDVNDFGTYPDIVCDICSEVRVCLINYKNHETSDGLSQRFKNSIDETCKKYKIYI